MESRSISIDKELAKKASCRVGDNQVLIMPWYASTLNKHPSNCLEWIGQQGRGVLEALKYLHESGYVHMDVKAMNIFVDHTSHWYLGDFGSYKPIGAPVTSCTTKFCYEQVLGREAHPKYDYFMFLLMILIESLEDRREYLSVFYDAPDAKNASFSKVCERAQAAIQLDSTPDALKSLLTEVLLFVEGVM